MEEFDDIEPVQIPISDVLDLHTFNPRDVPELLDEYPHILISGSKFMPMFHSEHRQFGIGHREKHPNPLAYIHPETANPLGIKDGDWMYIETKRGRIKQMARVTGRW